MSKVTFLLCTYDSVARAPTHKAIQWCIWMQFFLHGVTLKGVPVPIEVEVDESLFFHRKSHQGQAKGNTAMDSTTMGVRRRGKNAESTWR